MAPGLLAALAAVLLTTLLVSAPPAAAAADVTGKLRDLTTGQVLAGETVRLRRWIDGDTPGVVVDSDVTDAQGNFTLTPDVAGDRYFVQLVAGDYQNGYLARSNQWFIRLGESAQFWYPGVDLGSVYGYPAFIRGRAVDADTGDPVAGVLVTVRDPATLAELARDRTDSNGAYRMDGFTDDTYGIKFNGSSVGYETGYLGCARGVVPTWGEACAFGTGRLGKARLDRE